jgi:adenine phosphoribosyltransferase
MSDLDDLIDRLVRPIEDWPTPGVTFRDITPLLGDPAAFSVAVDGLVSLAREVGPVDAVLGIEARGFLFGPSIAQHLGVGFVPVRKAGKLPATSYSTSYDLEYGSATMEMHVDAISSGDRVLVVDDVLATGGTARATAQLIEEPGAVVHGLAVMMELSFLPGREAIGDIPLTVLHRV